MRVSDTIAAISSAVGSCGRIIVRLSGPRAGEISQHIIVRNGQLRIGGMRISAGVYCFVGPRSYTGDDLMEFQLPGSPILAGMLLQRLIALGARQAEPGEFTARAFFNGRLDLTQAEGVAATVSAGNDAQLRAARQLMAGELANRLKPLMERLTSLLALVEAEIDFSDEGIRFVDNDELEGRITEVDSALDRLVSESARFERTNHEPTIVLAGRPNAGKSTLLNALAGRERAIVSPLAGTTRDALTAQVALPRGMVRLVDVAGLEEIESTGEDIPFQMQSRALREIEAADVVVQLQDGADSRPPIDLPRQANLVVRTKLDLISRPPPEQEELFISAKSGENIDRLRQVLDGLAFGADSAADALTLNTRHLAIINEATLALKRAKAADSPELVAADLRQALDCLGQILGQVTPDDVLGKIFSAFCIGK